MPNIRKQKVHYRIAGLILEIVFPVGLKRKEILPTFESFLVEPTDVLETICRMELQLGSSLQVQMENKLLSDHSLVWGDRFCFYQQNDGYVTTIQSQFNKEVWMMKSSNDFRESSIYLLNEESSYAQIISWLVMMAFGQACLWHRTVLIHASVVACNGKAYGFLGASGTGKSTHSRLWLQHIEGATLINDDNPAIRIEQDDKVYVYGTPWSGKTPCYKNIKVQMHAFVRLKQAPYNKFTKQSGMQAFIGLLPSCTALRWNKELFSQMNTTIQSVVQSVVVGELDCLPDKQSAMLCYQSVTN